MTWKHWCWTSESAAITEFRISTTSWEVRSEWVKTELKLFLQSKFFANPSANLPSLPFCFRLRNNLSRPWCSMRERNLHWARHRTINLRCDTGWKLASISGFRQKFDAPCVKEISFALPCCETRKNVFSLTFSWRKSAWLKTFFLISKHSKAKEISFTHQTFDEN